MSAAIIAFPAQSDEHVALDAGWFVEETGGRGGFAFFLELVCPKDGVFMVWWGSDYASALRAAAEWRVDGFRVEDRIGGRA